MRLFINPSIFISVIESAEGYSCQIMELVTGIGFQPATFHDNPKDLVSCVKHTFGDIDTNRWCKNLEEVTEFHSQAMKQIHPKRRLYSAPETMVYSSDDDNALLLWETS